MCDGLRCQRKLCRLGAVLPPTPNGEKRNESEAERLGSRKEDLYRAFQQGRSMSPKEGEARWRTCAEDQQFFRLPPI
jgi:hypothetical protein